MSCLERSPPVQGCLYRGVLLYYEDTSYAQALDGSSLLYRAYSEHLSMAVEFYTNMLAQLEERYQLPVTSMDHSQLAGIPEHVLCVCYCCPIFVRILFMGK